jgi:putative Mn2+ efflux pump MntP
MRNPLIRLLLLPFAMLLWIIGWSMIWTALAKQQPTQQTQVETTSKDDFTTITTMIPEEPEKCET